MAVLVAASPSAAQMVSEGAGEGDPPRFAFLVGNNNYRFVAPLANPVNDARLIAEELEAVGFEVFLHEDITRAEVEPALEAFGDALRAAPSPPFVVIYYAGHGVEYLGENYLIPVDAKVRGADELREQSVNAAGLMKRLMDAPGLVRFVIFDACRDNPFPELDLGGGKGGLARMETSQPNIFIGYATSP
ncbi:MAG: caspase family protein, partial [Caulobacterales bacterium]|nr:caspase family protein [Caulobacterales bacterium]